MRIYLNTLAVVALGISAVAAQADTINPWNFNVVSLGDIGTTYKGYGSDFQGSAAVLGNAYFSNFSLHDVASAGVGTPYSLYAGGDVKLSGSINNGGVQAGGNVYMNGASINGLINAGGNLGGSGGSVNGNVMLGGYKTTGNQLTVHGSVTTNTAFEPTVDLGAIGDYFRQTSQTLGAMADNNTIDNKWGGLSVTLHAGVNVVSISGNDLRSAWGFTVRGSSNASLIINVTGSNVSLDSTTWTYNGVDAGNVLLNLADATTLNLSGGNMVNLLASNAATNFSSGVLAGNLIVGSLTGGGQVNAGFYTGDGVPAYVPPSGGGGEVPEPASMALLACGSFLVLGRGRSARRSS